MPKLEFNIGSKIHCKDADCGELDKIVYDPFTHEITDLIVREGLLFKTDRVIPVTLVERTAPNDVFLTIQRSRYENFPKYREYEYEIIDERPAGVKDRSVTNSLLRIDPYGVPSSQPLFPAIKRRRVQQNIAPHEQVLESGTNVSDMEENKLGTLDHVLLDQETCKISHIVVDRGQMNEAKVVPDTMIEAIAEDNIIIHANEEELLDLPSYIPRGDEHILAEAQEYLKLKIKQQGIKLSVQDQVMQLNGYVKTVLDKRRVEAVARAIRGVVDVENNLRTDAAIQTSVTAALLGDKRTEVSLIDVESEYGIVTLKGVVDSEEIAKIAETIARLQPGVNLVINELEEQHDEYTLYLQNRLGWEIEKMKDMSYFPGG